MDFSPGPLDDAQVQSLDVQGVLDSIPVTVALLDPSGVIKHVNGSWRDFAASGNAAGDATFLGSNYFEICEKSARRGDYSAATFLGGIQSLRSGRRTEFSFEYPCDGPDRRRWFRCVTRVCTHIPGARYVVVHIDVTGEQEEILRLRATQRDLLEELDLVKHLVVNKMPSADAIAKVEAEVGVEIGVYYKAAKDVGGDAWRIGKLPCGSVRLAVIDVSGHGVFAALVSLTVSDHLDAVFDQPSPRDALQALNRRLCHVLTPPAFVAATVLDINPKAMRATCSTAAAPKMMVVDPSGMTTQVGAPATPVGVDPSSEFENHGVDIRAGDIVLAYTDGLPDALNLTEGDDLARIMLKLASPGEDGVDSADHCSDAIDSSEDDILLVGIAIG